MRRTLARRENAELVSTICRVAFVDNEVDLEATISELLRMLADIWENETQNSDVRMTMRNTHIGLNDQAEALASLPSPQPKPATPDTGDVPAVENAGQHSGQYSVGPNGQNGSRPDNGRQRTKKNPEASSTVADGTYDAPGQSAAESGTDSAEWRRRGSNPRPETFPCALLRV